MVADALSRRYTLITTLEAKLLGFELIKDNLESPNVIYTPRALSLAKDKA